MGQVGLRDAATCVQQCIVTLYPWEWTTCSDIGNKRHANNWTKKDSKNYTAGRLAGRIKPEQQASPRTVIGEFAVAKFTNQFWSPMNWHISEHAKYEPLPDVGHNTEVRTVMKEDGAPKVHQHELGRGLVLWAAYVIPDEFYQVRMLGWLPYDLAWERGEPVVYGKSGEPSETDKQVAQRHLYHPIHTEASVAATLTLGGDPTKEPVHGDGCLCRRCRQLLGQVNLPEF